MYGVEGMKMQIDFRGPVVWSGGAAVELVIYILNVITLAALLSESKGVKYNH